MKKDIHPELKVTVFHCGCGNTFTLLSVKGGTVYLETCNQCHPFYAGKLKLDRHFWSLIRKTNAVKG